MDLDRRTAASANQEDAVDAARALAAIRALPCAYRETLMFRLVEGMSADEIAQRTGLTSGSVRVNLHRGMRLLREKLGVTDD
jgi:RNA polymerase sigma-70 factor (ECF subfamily)